MSATVQETAIEGVRLITPRVHGDARGYFFECWRADRYAGLGVPERFVQDNVSRSRRGVLRGLHVQHPHSQGKLVQVFDGAVFDVAVDVRVGSPTFGQWVAYELSADNHCQLYTPPGIAHGFCVLSESALLNYKCTEFYRPDAELTIAWNDPAIGIEWPISEPVLSEKDSRAHRLQEQVERMPSWL
jgi:dTDP-4-dehydrorhamnose 3,5-epimerase